MSVTFVSSQFLIVFLCSLGMAVVEQHSAALEHAVGRDGETLSFIGNGNTQPLSKISWFVKTDTWLDTARKTS